jgi:hypothetical protein
VSEQPEALEAECFWIVSHLIWDFIQQRNALDRKSQRLLCLNIVFNLPKALAAPIGQRQFEKPYWILRRRFTRHSIMIGDFWTGERENDREGKVILSPPMSFFSIRSTLHEADKRFIQTSPALADDFATSKVAGLNISERAFFAVRNEQISGANFNDLVCRYQELRKIYSQDFSD